MKRRSFVRLAGALGCSLALAGVVAGCSNTTTTTEGSAAAGSDTGSAAAQQVELQVFAANSLEKAMPEVEDLYTEKTGVTFADTQYRGSGDLVEQMTAGAQVDVLITASSGTMDDAVEGSLVDESTRTNMFVNDLVIVAAQDSNVQINSLEDVANVEGNIAIGEPGAVPAGRYASQSLASVGLYSSDTGQDGTYADSIASRVNQAQSVGNAAQYVASGDCTIGFVYSSDVYRYDGLKVVYTVPADSHSAIVYPGAVSASSENPDVAADFIDFCMNDEDALAIWAEYGFELSEE